MNTKTLVSLLVVAPHVWAATSNDRDGNLTVAFFPDSQANACETNDISKAITLTTSTIPSTYVCFNISDIFTQKNSTGFQNTTNQAYGNNTVDPQRPNGIAWLLQNQNLFDAKANYTQSWLQMTDAAGAQQDKRSSWNFYQYTLPGCQQIGPGEANGKDTPWFQTSCQTSEQGRCDASKFPIRSFAIHHALDDSDDKSKCEKWTQYGDATTLGRHIGSLVVGVAGAATLWLVAV